MAQNMTCPGCGATVVVYSQATVARCEACYHVFAKSPAEVKDRLAFVTSRISICYGEIMELIEERKFLEKAIIPHLPVQPVSPWKKYSIDGDCHKCGRKTRWAFRGAWLCFEGKCRLVTEDKKPRQGTRLTMEDLSDVLRQMGILNDDSNDGPEVIKKGGS